LSGGAACDPVDPAAAAHQPPGTQRSANRPRVRFQTSRGDFVLELTTDLTPTTCNHFLRLVDEGFFDKTAVHGIGEDRLVGGGRFSVDGVQKPCNRAVKGDEWPRGLANARGTVGLLRQVGDPRTMAGPEMNRCKDSGAAEFYVNLAHHHARDRRQPDGAGFTVFARVVEGLDMLDVVSNLTTQRHPTTGEPGWPVEPVVIHTARREDIAKPRGRMN